MRKTLAGSVAVDNNKMTIDNLISRPEFYYWYLVPTIAAAATLVWTTSFLIKKVDVKNVCFSVSTFFLLGLSQWVLIKVFFRNAWPTYLPHIATGISIIIVTIQYFLNRRNTKTSEDIQSHTVR